jgi:photosystem II stability/assembly factor-like uncharacterized protein
MKRIVIGAALFLFTHTSHAQWVQPNGPWGGQVTRLATNDGTVFAGTYDGVFRSTDNGDHWEKLNNCAVWGLVAFAVKGSAVYAGSFGALFVTHDKGNTWTDLSAGLPKSFELFTLAIKGDTIFAGFDDDPIYYSTDDGVTWKNTNQLMTTFHLWVYEDILFAGSGIKGLSRSIDNGKTWAVVDSDNSANSFTLVDSTLLIGTDCGIIRSVDRGVTWEKYGEGISEFPISTALITDFAVAHGVIFAASPRGVYTSTDTGAHWTLSTTGLSNQRINAMAVNGSTIFAGSSPRGVFRSLDNGASWENTVKGMSNLNITDIVTSGDLIAAGCDGGILLSYDKGKNWQWADIPYDIYVLSIVKKGDVLLAGTNNRLLRSRDNGKQWTCIDSGSGWYASLAVGNDGFFGVFNNALWHSPDSGASWVPKFTEKAICTYMVQGDSIIVGTAKALYRSTDNGTTWVKYDTSTLVNYHYPNNFLQVGATLFSTTVSDLGYEGIYRSDDKGIHWTDMSAGLGDSSIHALAAFGTTLFAGTSSHGVYMSSNNGESWTSVSEGTSIAPDYIKTLAVNNATIYAGTGGNGLWERPISEMVKIVDQDAQPAAAKRLDFRTYSPQATNKHAAVAFTLSQAEYVSVRIFDVSGREVASIVNARHGPGSYSYRWNIVKFQAGYYIARIKAGSNMSVGAITIIR